jgi:probable rRNA maturation factor
MSVSVDVSSELPRLALSTVKAAELARRVLAAEKVREVMLSIAFVPRATIARLNREHLGHRGATDVISFGFNDPTGSGAVVGDVYICPEVAADNARRHGARVREELARLVVHGTLHVLGHDHPDGEARVESPMWLKQERLVARLLPVVLNGRASSLAEQRPATRKRGSR